MKEYDRVKLIVEKEEYASEGVHKGMDGWICDPRNIDGQWLVCFDQYGDLPDIAMISVKEKDLEVTWEAPELKVGVTVLFLSGKEAYTEQGLTKGLFGIVCEQCEDENYYKVKFELEGGTEKIATVYYNDMSPIRDDEVEAYKQEVARALKRRQNG